MLGECGFLNNIPVIVTAVLPLGGSSVPSVGVVKTSGGQTLRFNALSERFFPKTDLDKKLMLQSGRFCPTVKPEVAALHWLQLAASPRSSMRMPPQDVDFTTLDVELLRKLAWQWDLSRLLEDWIWKVAQTGDIKEPSALGFSKRSITVSQAAKSRLLARKSASVT